MSHEEATFLWKELLDAYIVHRRSLVSTTIENHAVLDVQIAVRPGGGMRVRPDNKIVCFERDPSNAPALRDKRTSNALEATAATSQPLTKKLKIREGKVVPLGTVFKGLGG